MALNFLKQKVLSSTNHAFLKKRLLDVLSGKEKVIVRLFRKK
jgi:hypothetical protein